MNRSNHFFNKNKFSIITLILLIIVYLLYSWFNKEGNDFANCRYVNTDSTIGYIDAGNQSVDTTKSTMITACFYGSDYTEFYFAGCDNWSDSFIFQSYMHLVDNIKISHPNNLQNCLVLWGTSCSHKETLIRVTKQIFKIDSVQIADNEKGFEFKNISAK